MRVIKIGIHAPPGQPARRFAFGATMPVIDNPKHERFAQALASGLTADEAYEKAGYSAHRGNASRLSANENILRRLKELQHKASENTVVTLTWLIDKAEEARQGAMSAGQHAAAVSAIKEMGVLSGVRVEKRENGLPGEFDGVDVDELRESVARTLGVDAESLAEARRARKQGGVRGQPHRVH